MGACFAAPGHRRLIGFGSQVAIGDTIFHHVWDEFTTDEIWYQDFGLHFLTSARRDYTKRIGIWQEPIPSNRALDFDLTNLVRYWAADPTGYRNNGIFIQPYSPTRRFEPHLRFHATTLDENSPDMRKPSILVYEVPEGDTPKDLGAPFALFYEAPPGIVRVEELAHLADQNETWLVAVNSSTTTPCPRIYSNAHPNQEDLEVYLPRTGTLYETILAATTEVEYINFPYPEPPPKGVADYCPAELQFGIDEPPIDTPWIPDQAGSYQPITRWDFILDPSGSETSTVLIRVPHPQPQS